MDHVRDDHIIEGSPDEQLRCILARHLCGWLTGHSAPTDHFLTDADVILAEVHAHGLRVHLAGQTVNTADGSVAPLTSRSR